LYKKKIAFNFFEEKLHLIFLSFHFESSSHEKRKKRKEKTFIIFIIIELMKLRGTNGGNRRKTK
jgi:hypothetical protein